MTSAEFIASVVTILVFYIIIITVGVVSTIWFRRKHKVNGSNFDIQIVAGRKLGSAVGLLSMSATLVGGGFLNGTAESVAKDGLVWTLAPFGICIGLTIGGLVYAPRMRRQSYRTMLDPLEEKYGGDVTALIFLCSLFGDVLWTAAILAALGTTISVVIGLSRFISVIISAIVAIFYTLIGQMVSVAYTDIAELVFMALGLVLVTPFAMTHPDIAPALSDSVTSANSTAAVPWLGSVSVEMASFWVDLAITMTLGSIPWQAYFQRVLSVNSVSASRIFSVGAGGAALLFALPPVCLGVVGSVADWNSTDVPVDLYEDKSLTLPLVIQTFTPVPVAVIGLGAVAAAVMSSTDSAILGSSSMFTNHVYRRARYLVLRLISYCKSRANGNTGYSLDTPRFKPASDRELSLVLKLVIILVGVVSTVVALQTPSLTIYGLFILAADIVFVAVLPQLTSALYIPFSNGYGGVTGLFVSLFLRLGAGEPLIQLPMLVEFPFYSAEIDMQLFPFRTFSMLCGILCTAVISYLAQIILTRVHHKYDILKCVNKHWTIADNGNHADSHGVYEEQNLAEQHDVEQSYSKRDSLAFEEF